MARDHLGQVVKLVAAAAAPAQSDRALLEAFVNRQDQTAFALLVQRYGPLVLGVCRRVLQDNHDAEDADQATFLILARKSSAVRWQDTVRGWLYRVAYPGGAGARARRGRRQRHEQAASTLPRPGADLTWQEVAGVLDDELNRLPARYRDVLVLCYLEGKTRDEAAEQLGRNIGSVKKRLERARELLRLRLAARGLPLSAALLASLLDQQSAPAAVPALTLTQALRWATVPAGTIPTPILSLAEGVMKAMALSKLKMVAAVGLLVALLGTGLALVLGGRAAALAPADIDGLANPVKPGLVAVSTPDKNGLVTMLRPVVTHLAPGDLVQIGLHWATDQGPIPTSFDEKTLAASRVLRDATLNSMTFTITSPDGKQLILRPKVAGGAAAPLYLYQSATYLLTLKEDGLEEAGGQSWKGPWADNRKAPLDAVGQYTIQVSGNLVRDKAEAIPFTSGTITMQRTAAAAGLKPLAMVEAAAQKALEDKGHKLFKGMKPTLVDDQAGNRLLRFSGPEGEPGGNPLMPWSRFDYTVTVKPDGTVAGISQKVVGTCVAQGTRIDTLDGPVAVEKIGEGDRVWGYDLELGRRVATTVRLVRRGQAESTLLFGGTLRVTASHPVFAGGEWKLAGDIGIQDALMTADLRPMPAGAPQRLDGTIAVFDLTVDEPHNYFAGGFLVHNKSRLWTASMDDAWYKLWPLPEAKGK